MAKSSRAVSNNVTSGSSQNLQPSRVSRQAKSVKLAEAGITTGNKFLAMFAGLLADIGTERVPVQHALAMCKVGSQMTTMLTLQMRAHGAAKTEKRDLVLGSK